MKCHICSKQAKIPFPNGNLCQNCFLGMLINRIKKDTKLNNPFKKDEKVLVFGKITEWFLRKIDIPLKITETNKSYDRVKNLNKYDKVVIPWTADDEANSFYSQMTSKNPSFKENKRLVKLFRTILGDELIKASKILKMNIRINKKSKEINKIHKKFEHSIFGLKKSLEEFKKAIK